MQKHTVLIVDDERGIRSALRRALREEGYELLFADGPSEAFEHLRQTQVDVIVSDHRMPRMTGLEFLTRVADDYPNTQRIMLTGQAELKTVVRAVNQGDVYRFLLKPWDDTELRHAIRMAISHLEAVRENQRLMQIVEQQVRDLRTLEAQHPGIFELDWDGDAIVVTP